MKSKHLFILSAILLLLGIGSLATGWNGTANLNAGWPLSAWSVELTGSARGGWALGGILATAAASVVFAIALIKAITD